MIRAALTVEEALEGMKSLEPKIKNYARLVVRKGVNVKPGQEVVVQSPVECAPFARVVVAEAYAAGAGHVTVIWADDAVTRLTYEHVDKSYFEQTPEWKRLQLDSLAQDGACFIFIEGADPAALKGIDPAKPAAASKARNTQCKVFRRGLDYNINPWCIAGAPVVAWAREVFSGDADEVAIYKLWNAILHTARADGQDPESDWELHDAAFEKNLRFLNDNRFDYLHYTAANGTDLTIGMTKGHEWAGGKGKTPDGHPFFPNIPTEECFISPMKGKAEGTVVSTMPLSYQGNLIENFSITFKGGRAVSCKAEKNQELLEHMIAMDEGAAQIGELALIPNDSPISNLGILFYNTLFDENASCHIALGLGFPNVIKDYDKYTLDEIHDKGVNDSVIHVDFMVGDATMNIDGITPDGKVIPVFRNGNWTEKFM